MTSSSVPFWSSLRSKMVLAFACSALVAGIAGLIGLAFVERIRTNVEALSERTSPLLVASLGLVDNARRMRATFEDMLVQGGQGAAGRSLGALDEEARGQLRRLRALSSSMGLDPSLDAADASEGRFVQALMEAVEASGHERTEAARLRERLETFTAAAGRLNAALSAVVFRTEGEIARSEDAAKVQVQTREATIESLGEVLATVLNEKNPILQSAYRLMRGGVQLQEIASSLASQADAAGLAPLEQQARQILKGLTVAGRKLSGRLRSADLQGDVAQITRGLSELEAALLGSDGISAAKADMLRSTARVAAGRELLGGIETAYFGLLREVEEGVGALNESMKRTTAAEIAVARTAMAILIVLVTAAGIWFGLWFSRRITEPLTLLTERVASIRESGGPAEWPRDDRGVGRDEIGILSRSFRAMIAELAEARQELIARSEIEIQTQFERLNAALDNMSQGLCMFDPDMRLVVSNRRFGEIHGLAGDLTEGTPLRQILEAQVRSAADPDVAADVVAQALAATAARVPAYFVLERQDGSVISMSFRPMSSGGSIATHEDITERRRAEARIAHMAHHDPLTELPNRLRFRAEMLAALTRLEPGVKMGVLCLDLDNFKPVNDTLGHAVGDGLLRAVSARLLATVREGEGIVARLGGDEFAVLQLGTEQPLGATALATRLIDVVSEPYEIDGHRLVIGTSIGIAIAEDDGREPEQLLKNADLALYRAKADGRGRHRFFEPQMDTKMQARRALELDLRNALKLGELRVFYQPLINLTDNAVSGFEALLRWTTQTRGPVPPSEFVPLAEEIGLIGEIGRWVLRQACADAVDWPDHITVAVNLSPVQFRSGTVMLDVVSALAASGLAPARLELEITEGVLLQNVEGTITVLDQLHALGVRISMDDFGTGYSSLSYLRQFPFDKIKIDRSFISELADTEDTLAIVRAVTGLGLSLRMNTTAEGVETVEQLRQVRAEGCTEAQGYLFSEARPASEVGGLIARLDRSLRLAA